MPCSLYNATYKMLPGMLSVIANEPLPKIEIREMASGEVSIHVCVASTTCQCIQLPSKGVFAHMQCISLLTYYSHGQLVAY